MNWRYQYTKRKFLAGIFLFLLCSSVTVRSGWLSAGEVSQAVTRVWEKDGARMVYVPGGEFTMGSDSGYPDEKPAHRVVVSPYWIDVYEVTNAQYARFVRATGYRAQGAWKLLNTPGRENLPVQNISWNDAVAYSAWAGKRLPSEAEWELAARGPQGLTYPWGNEWKPERCIWEGHRASPEPDIVVVDSLPEGKSPAGCYHMAGNALEWCADFYRPYPVNARMPKQRLMYRVARGGGRHASNPKLLRCSIRYPMGSSWWTDETGFRCVASGNFTKGKAAGKKRGGT